ncbi:hypothetical protein BD414DRAFT_494516 [Trametes punicea]|nr:hypothetical protein BD414DRAFT_494516 [Trametes punicea]
MPVEGGELHAGGEILMTERVRTRENGGSGMQSSSALIPFALAMADRWTCWHRSRGRWVMWRWVWTSTAASTGSGWAAWLCQCSNTETMAQRKARASGSVDWTDGDDLLVGRIRWLGRCCARLINSRRLDRPPSSSSPFLSFPLSSFILSSLSSLSSSLSSLSGSPACALALRLCPVCCSTASPVLSSSVAA